MTLQRDSGVSIDTNEPKKMKAVNAYYIAVAALLVGGLAGFTAGYFNVQPRLEVATAEKAELADQLDRAEQAVIDADAEAILAISEAEAKAEERLAEVEEREAAVGERETKAIAAEKAKAAREMTSGLHTVGKTVEAGVYDTNVTSGMCYYAWISGTGSDASIIDNNIVEAGPATVTLVDGQFFENSGCGTWTKQ